MKSLYKINPARDDHESIPNSSEASKVTLYESRHSRTRAATMFINDFLLVIAYVLILGPYALYTLWHSLTQLLKFALDLALPIPAPPPAPRQPHRRYDVLHRGGPALVERRDSWGLAYED